jgi:AraC family transcriptional regulator
MNRSVPGFRLMDVLYHGGIKLPKHSHESACFGVMLHGAMTENYRTRCLESHVRTVGFNAADEEHSNTISAEGARFLVLEVETEVTECALKHSPYFAQSAVFNGGEVSLLATKIIREWTHFDDISPLAIEGLGLELIAARCRASMARNLTRPEWLDRAQDLIRSCFTEDISLSYVANEVGVHRVQLARAFRQHYRTSIGDYVRNLRIELVQSQLCMTKLPLAEIATRAGFYDQAHMTRLFKRATGLTPAKYRELMR